jgi:hypothetical protein
MVGKRVQAAGDARDRQRRLLKVETRVQFFSLVVTFLVGGYGLFYFLSKTNRAG